MGCEKIGGIRILIKKMIRKSRILNLLPDKLYLKLIYFNIFRKKINLLSPRSFNEKIQWLKLYDRRPIYISLSDKYQVRKYVSKIVGEEYLIPLLGVWESFDEICFDKLPNQFVLKCTHDSGGVFVCKNKDQIDFQSIRKKFKDLLRKNYYKIGREWPYKNIKPRIICEELLVDEKQEDLIDYKILCFNGVPKCLFLCLDRRSESGLKVDFYDLDWNPLPFERHYPRSGRIINKPDCLDEMLELSRKLSKDIPFVRVDFYVVNGQIRFGELTFYPGSGFEEFTPESYDYLLGSWIDLSLVEKNQKVGDNVR